MSLSTGPGLVLGRDGLFDGAALAGLGDRVEVELHLGELLMFAGNRDGVGARETGRTQGFKHAGVDSVRPSRLMNCSESSPTLEGGTSLGPKVPDTTCGTSLPRTAPRETSVAHDEQLWQHFRRVRLV